MSVHRYPLRSMRADYLCAVAGFALSAVPLFTGTAPVVAMVLLPMTLLFGGYALRTLLRQKSVVTLSEEAITLAGLSRQVRIGWDALTSVSLGYYSAWREGAEGWMQLRLRGDGGIIRVESTIEGFGEIVQKTIGVAASRRIGLDPATLSNLGVLGVKAPLQGTGAP